MREQKTQVAAKKETTRHKQKIKNIVRFNIHVYKETLDKYVKLFKWYFN